MIVMEHLMNPELLKFTANVGMAEDIFEQKHLVGEALAARSHKIENADFEELKKTHYAELKENGWVDPDVDVVYEYNSYGFRDVEFDGVSGGIMCMGCSHTMGQFLPAECAWPSIVSKRLGIDTWNFGIMGGSNDSIYRLVKAWAPIMKPEAIFILVTYDARYEYLMTVRDAGPDRGIFNNMGTVKNNKFHAHSLYDNWLLDDHNLLLKRKQNMFGIKQVCKELNIPLILNDSVTIHDIPDKGRARDLIHFGRSVHEKFADDFIRQYDEIR